MKTYLDQPTLFLSFMLITIIFLSAPTSVFGDNDERYTNCSDSFTCGNITDIGYPFWGSTRADYCGYPWLGLNCTSQAATITIGNLTYQVLELNSAEDILTVARTDYIDTLCPPAFINTTLNETLFNFTSDTQNVYIYYGCQNLASAAYLGFSTLFTCPSDQTGVGAYYTTRNASSYGSSVASFLGNCTNNVYVKANQSAVQSINSTENPRESDLIAALDQGFGLQYDLNSSACEICRASGGWCGYNWTTSAFACFCRDQAYPSSCESTTNSGGKNKTPMIAGLSIAGAAVAAIGVGCWFMLFVQRRKRKTDQAVVQEESKDPPRPPSSSEGPPTPSTNAFESIPSYPSSKSDIEKGSKYFGVQVFSYSELEEATDNFDASKELGDGGFGTVYYGVLRDGRAVAVKRLYENNIKRAQQFMNEIDILTRLRHKNLVTLYGCTSRRSRELLLVYEYIPNGTVADHVHGGQSNSNLLPWHTRLSIAIETADALAYLHASDVIHRDVKTNNILLDNNFCVKVADFGLSRLFPNNVTHVSTAPQGTPGYVDPEYYRCFQLTDKSDVYSFGVVLIELISSLQPVDTSRHRQDVTLANMATSKIQNHELSDLVDPGLGFEKDYSIRRMITSVAELAFRCLQQEKDMRPTMEEVLEVLKTIEDEHYGSKKAEVMDIGEDDVGLLKQLPSPFSPEHHVADKWDSNVKMVRTF